MFKKTVLPILVLLGAVSLYAQDEVIPWRKNITMLLVPREPGTIQIAQDIARRYPVLLVCYQPAQTGAALSAWNGTAWVNVTAEDYTNGTFFAHRPRHLVIVEKEDRPAPETLTPDGFWCTTGNRLTSTDPRVVIHLLGRYFDFPYRYWMQFSKRYDLALEQINPGLVNVFWWHYRGDKVLPAMRARDLEADMGNWRFLDITPPAPVEPVMIEEEPEVLPPAEIPAEEPVEEPTEERIAPAMETLTEEAATEVTQADMDRVKEVMDSIRADVLGVETNKPVTDVNPFTADEIPAAIVVLPPIAE